MSYIARATPGYLPTLSAAALVEQNQNMTLEDKNYSQSVDPQSNSAMLKQRLELYWQEMVKYQEEVKKEQAKQKCQEVLRYQPPEVIEQAKNIVKAMLENDNLQSNIPMSWSAGNTSTNDQQKQNPQFNTSTSGNESTSKNGQFSPGNLCRSPTNRKQTDQQPLDLSATVPGKKRPAAEGPPKHPLFQNTPVQPKMPITLDENRNQVIDGKSYLPQTSSAPLDYQSLMRARLSQAQASHLQQWLVQQGGPPPPTDDATPNKRAKMDQTSPFMPQRGNNPMMPSPFAPKDTPYMNPNHMFPVPKAPHPNFPQNRTFSPPQMTPPTKGSPSVPSPNQNSPQVNGKRYKRYAKPPYSYVSLISLSILSSPEKKLRLSQILKRISEMFPFFNGSYQGWRDSVRHNLSQNECFVKVLKNPFRPTAKGNYWTINLSSIPHELLLRQNTLVSRYAQDSGYRYRKDLSEVFDLSTGEIKVKIPNHLLNHNSAQNRRSPLVDDPAAVMEAILLEETYEDDHSAAQSSQLENNRIYTLQDLFAQDENGEDESSRSRMRNNRHQKSPPSNLNSMNPSLAAYINQAKTPYLNHVSQMSAAMQTAKDSAMNPNQLQMPAVLDRQMLAFQMLQNAISSNNLMMATASQQQAPQNAAALMAAQNALLSKAISAKMNNPLLQNMLYAANQMNMAQKSLSPPRMVEGNDNQQTANEEQRNISSPNSDKGDGDKKNKRKSKPFRRSSVEDNGTDAVNTSPLPSSQTTLCDIVKPADDLQPSYNVPASSSPIKDETSNLNEQNNGFPITSTQQHMSSSSSETGMQAFSLAMPLYASPAAMHDRKSPQNEPSEIEEQMQSKQQGFSAPQMAHQPMTSENNLVMLPGFQTMFAPPPVHSAKM